MSYCNIIFILRIFHLYDQLFTSFSHFQIDAFVTRQITVKYNLSVQPKQVLSLKFYSLQSFAKFSWFNFTLKLLWIKKESFFSIQSLQIFALNKWSIQNLCVWNFQHWIIPTVLDEINFQTFSLYPPSFLNCEQYFCTFAEKYIR